MSSNKILKLNDNKLLLYLGHKSFKVKKMNTILKTTLTKNEEPIITQTTINALNNLVKHPKEQLYLT